MPNIINPFLSILGSLWPVIVGLGLVLWIVGSMGGLLGIIATGVAAVAHFGMNFMARSLALAGLVALIVISALVFKAVGAPDITSFFPTSATQMVGAGAANQAASQTAPPAPPSGH